MDTALSTRAAGVGADDRGQRGVDPADELDPAGVGLRRQHVARVLDQRAEVEVVRVEVEPPGLDLREVEHVVDDAQE